MARISSTNDSDTQYQEGSGMDESAEDKLNSQSNNPQSDDEGTEESRRNYEEIFDKNTNQEHGEVF